jgi:NitT/TauT family transport system ATP-binding protein
MDEPFSSLDYQARLVTRWLLVRALETKPRTVVFVTHDIEEAAQLADRILVLSDRPARICEEIHLNQDRPRDPTDAFVVDAIRSILSRLGLREVAQIERTNRLSGYEPAGTRI